MVRLTLSLYALSFCSVTFAQQVQKPNLHLPKSAHSSRDRVRKIFSDAFSAYTKFAQGHDDLTPVSKSFSDGRNGWGATIVDALGTMKIMGLDDLFYRGINFSSQIDFSKSNTPDTVSIFESTIRYMGGLLSAYELNGKKPQALVDKAKQLADKLALGFVDNQPIPFGFVDFSNNKPVRRTSNIAEAGTLSLEWATLSKYTNDPRYRELTENAVKHIAGLVAPLPGLAAQGIDPASGNFVGGYVTWGGGSDSYFEYLLKYPRLVPDADPIFVKTWQTAVDSSIKYLIKVSTVGGWTYLADFQSDRRIRHISSHLACFHGGNWILGGKLLNNQTIVDYGLKLTDACWNTYASTATKIGPEVFAFTSQVDGPQPPNGTDDGTFTGSAISPDQLAFNAAHGFYVFNGASDYILRPEVIESNFYAWRVTGNQKYLANAQSVVESFIKYLEVPGGEGGISGIFDVDKASITNDDRVDDTESFFFAEVMKYLYLTFDDPEHISLDKYVFTTEAQVLEAPPPGDNWRAWAASPPQTAPFNPWTADQVPAPQISPIPELPRQIADILGQL